MMDRRGFLVGAMAFGACSRIGSDSTAKHVKRMAITMDDFNLGFDIGLSQEQRHLNILEAFDAVGHKAAGFVTGSFANIAFGKKAVQDWLDRGHMIENHTWTHPHANAVTTQEYLADIGLNREYLRQFPRSGSYFRFPFLDDGRDRDQQIALFDGLTALDLLNAPVTIDTVDWFTSSRLEKRLREDAQTDLTPYRDYYVEMCVTLARHWDEVARILGFRSLPHQVLMHHNVLNGHFLKDVLLALKADGWTFIDAREALAFKPYHALPPEPTHGRNWLTLQQRKSGIDIPPYPQAYLGFGSDEMHRLGL